MKKDIQLLREHFISFETSKLANWIGFDENCFKEYTKNGDLINCHYSYVKNSDIDYNCLYSACTQSQLQTWLRNVYQIHVNPVPYLESTIPSNTDVTGYYLGPIYNRYGKEVCGKCDSNYSTYEEALEMGLQSALEFIETYKKV
jgi:hypothetical protein